MLVGVFFFFFRRFPGLWGFRLIQTIYFSDARRQNNWTKKRHIINWPRNHMGNNEINKDCLKTDMRSRVTGILSRENAKGIEILPIEEKPRVQFKWLVGQFSSAVITTSRIQPLSREITAVIAFFEANELRGFHRCASRCKSKVDFGELLPRKPLQLRSRIFVIYQSVWRQ